MYMYCNYRIYEIKEDGNYIFVKNRDGEGGCSYPKSCFMSEFPDHKLFNNFEEIIEVGDLLIDSDEGSYFAGLVSNDDGVNGNFCINDSDYNDFIEYINISCVNEIYKKKGNTFIRIAHKENRYEENEMWVCD